MKTGDQMMLWAQTGVGKTWASLSIALAVGGGGGFLWWKAPRPRKVLIVDGEMNTGDLQERLGELLTGACGLAGAGAGEMRAAARKNIAILARQDQDPDTEFPDLASKEGQELIMRWVQEHEPELILMDNFSTLAEVEDENAAGSMNTVLSFLMKIKTAGCATILVHHSGKDGKSFRGSSKLAATFEVIVGLQQPETGVAHGGAAFSLFFEKLRAVRNETHATSMVRLVAGLPGEGLHWHYERSEEDVLNQLVALVQSCEYPGQQALAKALGCAQPNISKLRRKALARGLIKEAEWNECLRAARAEPETAEELEGEGGEDCSAVEF